MRAVSTRFLNALRGSHTMAARARVVTSYQESTNPTGTEIDILSGDVQSSSRNDIRSTLELTTDGMNWDTSEDGLLTPYGNEIFIERGIVFGGGQTEWVAQGYFRIYEVAQEDAPDMPLRISARDRMSGIIDARLEAPVQFTAATSISTVFTTLVQAVYPTATITFDDTLGSTLLGRTVIAEQDRYAFLRDLVRAHGKIMYFDYQGKLQIKSPPDPDTAVWEINGGELGVLINMSRTLNREGIYNSVVATGEAADTEPPARGVVRDINPLSPTYFYGRFGPVPRFYTSPFITTNNQAKNAARQILILSLGRPQAVDFTAVPNPALEPLDPVSLDPGAVMETHVLDDINLPLVASGQMGAATRQQLGSEFEEEEG